MTTKKKSADATPGPGHNSGEDGPLAGDRLAGLVQRLERIEQDIGALNSDKRDVYAEAKSAGFDPNALREVLRYRRDPAKHEERWTLRDLYLRSIESAQAKP
jgi:uncharacterized protein (UPF0335 family)